jgi:hypothetical protein
MVPRADRIYEGLDLSVLGSDYQPDVLIDAESIAADGVECPSRASTANSSVKKGQVAAHAGAPGGRGHLARLREVPRGQPASALQ